MKNGFRLLLMAFLSLGVAGCTSNPSPEGKPLPQLTFDHVQPLMVDVASINIDNRYQPGYDMEDVSESFPTPPDMAIQNYTERRLQPAGNTGVLNVVIKDAHVYQSQVKPEGAVNRWFGMNDSDLYDILIKVSMFALNDSGERSPTVNMEFKSEMKIPEHYSIAEREAKQLEFLEELMKKVDQSYTKSLRDDLGLLVSSGQGQMPAYSYQNERQPETEMDERSYYAPDYNETNDGAMAPPERLSPPEMR